MTEHIVAIFETEAAATAASKSLSSLGISASAIRQYAGSELSEARDMPAGQTTTAHASGGGFWSWLLGEETTSETTQVYRDDDIYDRRYAAGDVVVSVTVDDTMVDQAIAALDAHDPLDIDEHTAGARAAERPAGIAPMTSTTGKEFSSGEVAQAGLTDTTSPTGRVDVASTPVAQANSAVEPVPSSGLPTGSATTGTTREEVIPLAEEELQVGKRTVDRGTTRVRRYVVEKPVAENVTLQGERVTVERRQPIATASAPGTGAFEERVVEVRETTEEPVVSKTARVVEEVVVSREATERTETVRDTVRREEVDVSGDGAVKH